MAMEIRKLEILGPLVTAIMANNAITSKLAQYLGSASVHSRRPVPSDAPYPMVVVGPMITRTNADEINTHRPVVGVDISVYGEQPTEFRLVDDVAEELFVMFHRQSIPPVENYQVIDVQATGPIVASADSEEQSARVVSLTIRLRTKKS